MSARRDGGARRGRRAVRAAFCVSAGLSFALALGVSGGPTEAQAAEEAFSQDERRRLRAGELVTRPVHRRRGQHRLMGGSSWQVVSQPSATTWRALNDIGAYPRMLPNTASAREVEADGEVHVVELRHEVGFVHARYFLRMRFDDARRDVSFRLDPQRDNDLRSAWGFLSVDDFEEDPSRSLISFGVMAEPGGGMLAGLIRPQIHEWLLRVPETIRAYMHGSGRNRY